MFPTIDLLAMQKEIAHNINQMLRSIDFGDIFANMKREQQHVRKDFVLAMKRCEAQAEFQKRLESMQSVHKIYFPKK